MSEDWNDENYEGYGEEPDLVKNLRSQLKEKSKADKERDQEISALRAQVRSSVITDVLKSKSVPAEVAELVPSEVNATPEDVETWLTKYGHLFGASQPTENAAVAAPIAGQQELTRMQDISLSGIAPGSSAQEVRNALTSPDLTIEQLRAMIAGGNG